MPELRKRKTPPPAPPKPAKKERKPKAEKTTDDKSSTSAVVATSTEISSTSAKPPAASATSKTSKATKSGPPQVGDKIDLNGFGGEVEDQDGKKTTLKALVEESQAGIVIFTYPKASTPGCKSTLVTLHRF